jgi:soluble lytic murein transglycosylase-like protein
MNMNATARMCVAVTLAAFVAAGGAVIPAAANAEVTPLAPLTPLAGLVASLPATLTLSVDASLTIAPSAPATVAAPPVAPAASAAKKLTVRQIIAKIGKDKGLSKSQVDALLWIAKHESNFHPTSKSSSGCYGLFQLSKGMAKGHPWKDPTWNTKRAIKYMKGRYGGTLQAKRFWLAHHWY